MRKKLCTVSAPNSTSGTTLINRLASPTARGCRRGDCSAKVWDIMFITAA